MITVFVVYLVLDTPSYRAHADDIPRDVCEGYCMYVLHYGVVHVLLQSACRLTIRKSCRTRTNPNRAFHTHVRPSLFSFARQMGNRVETGWTPVLGQLHTINRET